MLATSAPFVAVMHGDLQHDEKLLPQTLSVLRKDNLDIIVGSRRVADGSLAEWAGIANSQPEWQRGCPRWC